MGDQHHIFKVHETYTRPADSALLQEQPHAGARDDEGGMGFTKSFTVGEDAVLLKREFIVPTWLIVTTVLAYTLLVALIIVAMVFAIGAYDSAEDVKDKCL